jgi:hypothetical protein
MAVVPAGRDDEERGPVRAVRRHACVAADRPDRYRVYGVQPPLVVQVISRDCLVACGEHEDGAMAPPTRRTCTQKRQREKRYMKQTHTYKNGRK